MIKVNQDGSATIDVEAGAVTALLYAHKSIDTLLPAVEAAVKLETAHAEKWYKVEYKAGRNDGSIYLNKEALLAAFRACPSYMTAQQRFEAEQSAEKDLQA